MQRFEAYSALMQTIHQSSLSNEDKAKLTRVLRFFPRKRREVLNAVEEQLVYAGLVQETEDGLVVNDGPDGTYASGWMLLIQALITFLPLLLELLKK